MKLFTTTQIDQILEKVAQQNPKNDFNGLISSLLQPNKDNINQFDFDLLRIFSSYFLPGTKGKNYPARP